MKSGESGEAVRYRKVTHGDGSVSLKKAACHDTVSSAYAAVAKIHDSHMTGDALTEELYETIIQRVLISEAISADDVKRVEDVARLYLNNVVHAKKDKNDHIRIHSSSGGEISEQDKLRISREIVRNAFSLIKTTSRNAGLILSRKYDSYEVTGQDAKGDIQKYYIIFAATQTTGTRGGGYKYEKEIGDSFYASGVPVSMPGNPKKTDLFICKGKHGIEIKASTGRFGEPTLMYDYKAQKFDASENIKQAKEGEIRSADIVTVSLNGAGEDAKAVRQWMESINDAWFNSTGEKLEKFSNNITADQYDMHLKGKVRQSALPVKISIGDVIKYYIGKEAKYFQIQGKGLYAIDDVLNLKVPFFITAAADTQPSVKLQMALTKDKKVLRATISLDLSKLESSEMNLDNPQDLATVASRCTLEITSEGVTVLRSLISEELTASDKREIERISRRQARLELDRAVGPDLGKAIREEVSKTLGSRATREEITDMIEAVLKRLHVEIGH